MGAYLDTRLCLVGALTIFSPHYFTVAVLVVTVRGWIHVKHI